jgi:hypothetical protein
MKYDVDMWSNFCRVFELPEEYVNDYCFGGGHATNFQMVDWFCPVNNVGQAGCDKETWLKEVGPIEITRVGHEEMYFSLIKFLKGKNYVKPGRKYLVLCDFGMAFTFEAEQ